MPTGFPPQPSYPLAIDSDRTLFLVFNTSEAKTVAENSAWEEEIEIEPVAGDQREIWADNGFANISGELFYYDAVEKNEPVGEGAVFGAFKVDSSGAITSIPVIEGGSGYYHPSISVVGSGKGAKVEAVVENGSIVAIKILVGGKGYVSGATLEFHGKVFKLKRCARNIGGKKTRFNPAGTWVRGFVMAEHHNQLVDATVAVEKYVLDLEGEIAKLESEPVCIDDSYCVDVRLDTEVIQTNQKCEGTTISYNVVISGTFGSFILDFGDGNSTSAALNGTHNYAPGANIDPIVTVTSDSCTVVQTPTKRSSGRVPESPTTTKFNIPVPQVPAFPTITIPTIGTTNPTLELPQIIFPCLETTPTIIPSIIQISITPPYLSAFKPI